MNILQYVLQLSRQGVMQHMTLSSARTQDNVIPCLFPPGGLCYCYCGNNRISDDSQPAMVCECRHMASLAVVVASARSQHYDAGGDSLRV